MGLFSKPNIPGIDTGALTRIAEQNAATQKDLLGRKKLALQPLQDKFRTDRAALSGQVEPGTENLLTKYGTELAGIGDKQKAANEASVIANRATNFRDVPELQRSIRESLGGGGLLNSGVASRELSRPVLDAARSSSDFSNNLEIGRLNDEARRSEGFAGTGFNARSAALNKRLGIDEDTLNSLAEMGRTDLLDEYSSLAGIEGDLGDSRLNIEQARQANEIERAKASAARRGQVLSTIGTVAGGAAGFALGGGPLGAGLGAQLGGSLGNMAGGGSGGSIDPTLLFALAQRRGATPSSTSRELAIKNSLGGRGY